MQVLSEPPERALTQLFDQILFHNQTHDRSHFPACIHDRSELLDPACIAVRDASEYLYETLHVRLVEFLCTRCWETV